jgi:Ca2+-binding EF-hand superfamily protein
MQRCSRFFGAAVLVGVAAIVAPAWAQAPVQEEPAPPLALLNGMQNYREAYLAQLFSPFRAQSGPDQVLTADDVSRAQDVATAGARAAILQGFFSRDLNGDGSISQDELQSRDTRLPGRDGISQMDADRDGTVTFDEAKAYAKLMSAANTGFGRNASLKGLLDLDPNRDGQLTADELDRLGRAAFAVYDTDGDGVLSDAERVSRTKAMGDRASQRAMEQQALLCNFPKPGKTDRLIYVNAYEAGALSDVTVVGQDEVTETAELNIEAGDAPLYLLVSSHTPIIWRVTGHVERVTRFVASSSVNSVGVTGLAKDKVTTLARSSCLQYSATDGPRAAQQAKMLEKIVGKPVDAMILTYTLPKATLPSDGVAPRDWKPQRRPAPLSSIPLSTGGLRDVDRTTYSSFTRFNPAGLVRIDPAAVVSSGTVERYQVLPQEAGLLQLLMEGSIETPRPGAYLIKKPIARFPAGLAGAHRVTFMLGEGVPRPAGNPGHSRVGAPGEFTLEGYQTPLRQLPLK